jgi:hypothetical protein
MDRLICSPCIIQWKLKRLLAFLPLAFLLAILTGCGGGSGAAGDVTADDFPVEAGPPTDPAPPGDPEPGVRRGSAVLSWSPPTTNTDGSPVSLAGFIIYVGKSPRHLHRVRMVSVIDTTAVMKHLPRGKYFFAVTAISTTGAESALSNIESKRIRRF